MNPGKLDILGTIEQDTGVKNAAGERVSVWTSFGTLWLQKIGISAREGLSSDQIIDITVEEFKCRTVDMTGITAKMRMTVGTDIYNIIQILYGDRMYSKLICQKSDNS
jgi:head-tail adaptor